jgi:hypothetical protein
MLVSTCCISFVHFTQASQSTEPLSATSRVKGKAVPLRSIEAHLGDRRYSSYSFLTLALEGGERSASRPGRALPPGKGPQYPLYRRLGGP